MKKLFFVLAVFALAGSLTFAETEISFYNKVYMEDAFWGHDDAADENIKKFSPVKNKFDFQLASEKFDAEVKGIIYFADWGGETYGFTGELKDAWVEFRPIEQIGIAFRENIVAWPSSLPIYDDDLKTGNIGSDGFTALFRPSPLNGALTVAATIPFGWDLTTESINYVNGENELGEKNKFNFGLGAAYTHDYFEVSVRAANIINNDKRELGATIGFPNLFGAVENLNIGFGYEYNKAGDGYDDFINYLTVQAGVYGENLLDAVVTYETDKFAVIAEAVTNFSEDTNWSNFTHDLYAALEFDLHATEKLTLAFTGKIATDFTNDDKAGEYDGTEFTLSGETLKNAYMAGIGASFDITEHHSVGAGFEVGLQNKNYGFAVPVSWTYTY